MTTGETSSGMGLLIGGAIILAAVGIFAAVLSTSGGAAAAPKANSRRRNPRLEPMPGYAFFYDGSNWKRSSEEMWDTEMMTESDLDGATFVGNRTIDGTRVNVWQLKTGHHYIAQTARA